MRLAGPAALALLLAACTSAWEPPPPAWSEWSAPLKGLSGRVSVPRSVLRGDRVAAVLELRVDAATLPAGTRWFDPGWIEECVRLRPRHAGTGATVELDVHPWEKVIETPELTEDGVPAVRADPGWIPLAEVDGPSSRATMPPWRLPDI